MLSELKLNRFDLIQASVDHISVDRDFIETFKTVRKVETQKIRINPHSSSKTVDPMYERVESNT